MTEYYTRTDAASLIKVGPDGYFYLDKDGNWIEEPDLRFTIWGDPDDGPFQKAWFENDLVRLDEDEATRIAAERAWSRGRGYYMPAAK